VGLIRAKVLTPGMTQTELAKRAGISQGAVSNLLKAYEESTPALRGLFAEGTDARTIVELQSAFAGLPEKDQAGLADRLRGASQQEAQGIRTLVEQGFHPAVAVGSAMSRKHGTRAEGTKGAGSAGGGETGSKETEIAGDGKQLKALAEYTGAPLRSVKVLAEQAIGVAAGAEVLTLACAYVGHGGSERNALKTGAWLAEDRKSAGLLKTQLHLEHKARQLIAGTRDARVREILTGFFFGYRSHGTAR
jgi:transcriptional regulator with XRE-family HTH domain